MSTISGFTVRDIMDRNVVSVREETTLEELLILIRRYRITEFPVVDREAHYRGMVYEPDLFRALYSEDGLPGDTLQDTDLEAAIEISRRKTVGQIMTRDALQISGDEHILRAGAEMLHHKVAHAPVTEGGQVIGMITQKKIFSEMMSRSALMGPDAKSSLQEAGMASAKSSSKRREDQRLFKRFNLQMVVAYKRTSEKGEEGKWRKGSLASTLNMSAGGFLIRVRENLPEKTLLDVAIDLFQKDRPIRRICRVVHCRPSIERDYYDAGIMMLALNPEEQKKVDAFLAHASGEGQAPAS